MADYHRMDLSVTLYRKKKPGKKYRNESSWVFSIYNVYARKNWFSLDFRSDEDGNRSNRLCYGYQKTKELVTKNLRVPP